MMRTMLFMTLATIGICSSAAELKEELTHKVVLNLAVTKKIVAAAEVEARKNNWDVSIAVVDESGQLLQFERMDKSTNASVEIAIAKAKHAANYRRDTKFHEDLMEKGHNLILSFPGSMPLEGGVRLLADDVVVGGIGVSGAQSTQDGQIAKAGADLLATNNTH